MKLPIKKCEAVFESKQALIDWLEPFEFESTMQVKIEPEKKRRSLDQNALMWAKLTELSRCKTWHGIRLSPTNWKHLITASMTNNRVVPNINNDGFVVLGKSTSSMSTTEMTEVIDIADYLIAELD